MSSSSQQLHYRTRMFARVIGPYLIAIATAAALRPADMKSMLSLYEGNPLGPGLRAPCRLRHQRSGLVAKRCGRIRARRHLSDVRRVDPPTVPPSIPGDVNGGYPACCLIRG
jgi:hypothetical protein